MVRRDRYLPEAHEQEASGSVHDDGIICCESPEASERVSPSVSLYLYQRAAC